MAFVDNSRVKANIFFIEKISFSLKLFFGQFYGLSLIKTVRGPLTESWMFILNQVGILYPFGVPSAPFDILVSH